MPSFAYTIWNFCSVYLGHLLSFREGKKTTLLRDFSEYPNVIRRQQEIADVEKKLNDLIPDIARVCICLSIYSDPSSYKLPQGMTMMGVFICSCLYTSSLHTPGLSFSYLHSLSDTHNIYLKIMMSRSLNIHYYTNCHCDHGWPVVMNLPLEMMMLAVLPY